MAEWDGRPQNPKRTAPHWIEDKALNHVACVVWCHVMEQWHDMALTMPPKGAAKFWRYLGPCLLPAEVEAQVAAAALAMREAAKLACNSVVSATLFGDACEIDGPTQDAIYHAIAALPLPSGDALASALAAARREGIEAAAAHLKACIPAESMTSEGHTARHCLHLGVAAICALAGGSDDR